MIPYRLFLDDVRQPQQVSNYITPVELRKEFLEEWVVVRSYDEFINHITEHGLPTHISFDHDLADVAYDYKTQQESFSYHEKTGYDAAKWLCDYCIEHNNALPICFIHSANPVGKANILNYLTNYKKHRL